MSQSTESALWDRLFHPVEERLSVTTAQSLLQLEFPLEDKERMHEPAAKARDGSLTNDEQEEITNYERVGNLLALMKSNARKCLKASTKTKHK